MDDIELGAQRLHHGRNYFDEMYANDDDPWGFESRWYERRKYDLTLAALPDEHYRRGLEPGCANGALTERLADRCDELVAFDLVDGAATRARARLEPRVNVMVHTETFPQWWPDGHGDLVVWSEVVYYLAPTGLSIALDGLRHWLRPGGVLVAVHYTGETDYPMSGDEVHERLNETPFLQHIFGAQDRQFRIDTWRRSSGIDGGSS